LIGQLNELEKIGAWQTGFDRELMIKYCKKKGHSLDWLCPFFLIIFGYPAIPQLP
jgi:hypothetical protein